MVQLRLRKSEAPASSQRRLLPSQKQGGLFKKKKKKNLRSEEAGVHVGPGGAAAHNTFGGSYQPPKHIPITPPSSDSAESGAEPSPVHHIVTTTSFSKSKPLNSGTGSDDDEDNETQFSDLTADRTYKRAVEQYQLEQQRHLHQHQLQHHQQQNGGMMVVPEDGQVLDPPGVMVRSESGAANTIMVGDGRDGDFQARNMEGAEVVVGSPQQDGSFISRIFGVVDQACSPSDDNNNNGMNAGNNQSGASNAIQKVLSFSPEWGVAPEREDDDETKQQQQQQQWKAPETYSIALTRDHTSMTTGPIQPQTQPQGHQGDDDEEEEDRDSPPPSSPAVNSTSNKSSQHAPRAVTPTFDTSDRTASPTGTPIVEQEHFELVLDEANLGQLKASKNEKSSKRGWMRPFRSNNNKNPEAAAASSNNRNVPVVSPLKSESKKQQPQQQRQSPSTPTQTRGLTNSSPSSPMRASASPSTPHGVGGGTSAASSSRGTSTAAAALAAARKQNNNAQPAKKKYNNTKTNNPRVQVKSRKAILAAAKVAARKNNQKSSSSQGNNNSSSSHKSRRSSTTEEETTRKPLPPMPPVQPLPWETSAHSRAATTTTSTSYSSSGTGSNNSNNDNPDESYRSKSPVSAATSSYNSSSEGASPASLSHNNNRLPPKEPVVEPDEYKEPLQQQPLKSKRGFLQKVRSFGNAGSGNGSSSGKKDISSAADSPSNGTVNNSTAGAASSGGNNDTPNEARLKQVLVAFHGASKGPLDRIVEEDDLENSTANNSSGHKRSANAANNLQVRVPGGGGTVLSAGDLIGDEVVDDNNNNRDDDEFESESESDYDTDDDRLNAEDERRNRGGGNNFEDYDDDDDELGGATDEDEEVRQLTASMVAPQKAAAAASVNRKKDAVTHGSTSNPPVSKVTPLNITGSLSPANKKSPTPATSDKLRNIPATVTNSSHHDDNMEATENTQIEAIPTPDMGKATKATWKERLGIRKVRSNSSDKKVTVEASSASPVRRQLSAPDKVGSTVSETATAKAQVAAASKSNKKNPWKVAKDPDTGREYYYHRITRKTTWSKPNALKVVSELEEESVIKKRIDDLPPLKTMTAAAAANASKKAAAAAAPDTGKKNTQKSTSTVKPKQAAKNTAKNIAKGTAKNSTTKDTSTTTSKTSQGDPEPTIQQKKEHIERLLRTMAPPDGDSVERLMAKYDGREDELLAQLRDLKDTTPFDEPTGPKSKARKHLDAGTSSVMVPMTGPSSMTTRTPTATSFRSGASGLTRISETTPQIKNTSKGRKNIAPIMEDASQATSISSKDNHNLSPKRPVLPFRGNAARRGRVPSRVPVPRSRELEVEEFTDEFRRNNIRGVVRAAKKAPVAPRRAKPVPPPDGHESLDDGTNEYDAASTVSGPVDDISALSMTDNEFMGRGVDNAEQEAARRRAFDDAVAREDWDLAAALSEGMRALKKTKIPSPPQSRREWTQTELDRFISENDWDAVANYIAKVRANNKASNGGRKSAKSSKGNVRGRRVDDASQSDDSHIRKRFGARSQLQHADLHSYSSWEESSSYEDESEEYSSGSDSSAYRRFSNSNRGKNRGRGRRGKEFAC